MDAMTEKDRQDNKIGKPRSFRRLTGQQKEPSPDSTAREDLEAMAFPAQWNSHRNALRLSQDDNGLMQSTISAQNAIHQKKGPVSAGTDRRSDHDLIVKPSFVERKEIWTVDRRIDVFSEKPSSASNSSIKVNIGRIEVHAAAPKPVLPQKVNSKLRSGLSLDDYLKRRR
jgi:hypothetical protein